MDELVYALDDLTPEEINGAAWVVRAGGGMVIKIII